MRKAIVMFLLLATFMQVNGQNFKFQALYVFNIARNIEWQTLESNLKIGVIDCDEMAAELQNTLGHRTIKGIPIKIKSFPSATSDVSACDLLYLGASSSGMIDDINKWIKEKPVLLITSKQGLKGAGINLIDNASKLEFEIFPSVISSQGLKFSKSLLNIGIIRD